MATSAPDQAMPTTMPAPAFGDSQTGFALASGVVAALLHRERTGEGIVVDTSLLNTGMWAMQTAIVDRDPVGHRGDAAPAARERRSAGQLLPDEGRPVRPHVHGPAALLALVLRRCWSTASGRRIPGSPRTKRGRRTATTA